MAFPNASLIILMLSLFLFCPISPQANEKVVSGKDAFDKIQKAASKAKGSNLEVVFHEILAMLRGGARNTLGAKRATSKFSEGIFPSGRLVAGELPIILALAKSETSPVLLVISDKEGTIYDEIESPEPGNIYLIDRSRFKPGVYRLLVRKGSTILARNFRIIPGTNLSKPTRILLNHKKLLGKTSLDIEPATKELKQHGYLYDAYAVAMARVVEQGGIHR